MRRYLVAALLCLLAAPSLTAEEPHFEAHYVTECDPTPTLGLVTWSLYVDWSEVWSEQLWNECNEITYCAAAVYCPNGENQSCAARENFNALDWCPARTPPGNDPRPRPEI